MDNETKLSHEQIKGILDETEGLRSDERINAEAFIKEHLNESQAQKVRSILSDPQKLKELMQSPAAQKIMAMLRKDGK